MLNKLKKQLSANCWALGFVRGGMPSIMESDSFDVDWVKMPTDRWFADPFVLDVTDAEILLLVEDFGYDVRKGVISLLHINRATMEITSRKVLLDQPYHLSFPAIWRHNGHIYVYPECAKGSKLTLYEYDPLSESLSFVKTICDDVVWDSFISEAFGEPLMFTAAHLYNDKILDIYHWDKEADRYIHYAEVHSDLKNSRLGGAVFEYKGKIYYPAQNCERTYGGAIDIKQINSKGGNFTVETIKQITSPNPDYPLGLHTLNEYKGVVVIDVKGYRYRTMGSIIAWMAQLKRKMRRHT